MRVCAMLSALFVALLLLAVLPTTPTYAEESWSIQTLDNYSSGYGVVAVDSKNNPHIIYSIRDITNKSSMHETFYEVKYASWEASDWNITTAIQYAISLDFVLDSNDNPHIIYKESGPRLQKSLMYATLTGQGWVSQKIDSDCRGGGSIALDSTGKPHVAYFIDDYLKLATWNGTDWNIQVINTPESLNGLLSPHIFLDFDSNDIAHIMYSFRDFNIHYIVGDGKNWNDTVIFEDCELDDMVLDSNGNPHIIYTENVLSKYQMPLYAQWDGTNWCSQNFQTPTNEQGGSYGGARLAIDSRERPHIIYHIGTDAFAGNLIYAILSDETWDFQTIDPNSTAGAGSIAVDSNCNPHVCYYAYQEEPLPDLYGRYLNYATANLTQCLHPSQPLNVSVVSPENKTYNTDQLPLTVTVNTQASSTFYSIDGEANISLNKNTTITNLTDGPHKLTIYTQDSNENTELSKSIYFTISKKENSEPTPEFPELPIILVSTAIIIGTIATFIIYKLKKKN